MTAYDPKRTFPGAREDLVRARPRQLDAQPDELKEKTSD